VPMVPSANSGSIFSPDRLQILISSFRNSLSCCSVRPLIQDMPMPSRRSHTGAFPHIRVGDWSYAQSPRGYYYYSRPGGYLPGIYGTAWTWPWPYDECGGWPYY